MGAEESEDDEATPFVAKAPPTRLGFATPPSGGPTSEEIATLAHGLTQAIIVARSNSTTKACYCEYPYSLPSLRGG